MCVSTTLLVFVGDRTRDCIFKCDLYILSKIHELTPEDYARCRRKACAWTRTQARGRRQQRREGCYIAELHNDGMSNSWFVIYNLDSRFWFTIVTCHQSATMIAALALPKSAFRDTPHRRVELALGHLWLMRFMIRRCKTDGWMCLIGFFPLRFSLSNIYAWTIHTQLGTKCNLDQ